MPLNNEGAGFRPPVRDGTLSYSEDVVYKFPYEAFSVSDWNTDSAALTLSIPFTVDSTLGVTGVVTFSALLNADGGIAVDTNKFTVADGSGNTLIAGTLGVTGLSTLASVDINGGNIDATTIGATTPAAGAFTTLSTSGLATLSSWSVTDGTVTMTGTISGTTGDIRTTSAHDLVFGTNDTERMRITSAGNVGIGTSSPDTLLHTSGTPAAHAHFHEEDSGVSVVRFTNTTDTDGWYVGMSGTEDFGIAHNVDVGGSSTSLFRIDTNGNLGVSPDSTTWSQMDNDDVVKGIVCGTTAMFAGHTSSEAVYYGSNLYYNDSKWKYLHPSSNEAALNQIFNGQFAWYSAPAGTAGNEITFTERMRLTAAGRLGIGTDSPDCALHVYTGNSGGSAHSDAVLCLEDDGNVGLSMLAGSSSSCKIAFGDSSDNEAGGIAYSHSADALYFYADGNLQWIMSSTVFGPNFNLGEDLATSAKAIDDAYADDWNNVSTIRVKKNVEKIDDTSWLHSVKPRRYNTTVGKSQHKLKYGLIAEEIYEYAPNLVSLDEEGLPAAYSLNGMVSVVISEVQRQKVQVDELERENAVLKERVLTLEGGTDEVAAK